jgi:hypothetical protein
MKRHIPAPKTTKPAKRIAAAYVDLLNARGA